MEAESDLDKSVEYVDDEFIEEMDHDDGPEAESDDFKTMNESEIGDQDQMLYDEGQILGSADVKVNDAVGSTKLMHQDHVYSVQQIPQAPFNRFISGDGADKCKIWQVKQNPNKTNEDGSEANPYECE